MEIPSAENQCEIIKQIRIQEKKTIEDGVYAIDGEWYRRYLRIIGFRNNDPINLLPGLIDNTKIAEANKLKYGLIYNYDYFIVTKSLWNLIKSWFGTTNEIHLKLYEDIDSKEFKIDISDIPIRAYYKGEKITKKRIFVDRFSTVLDFKRKICQIFGFPNDDKLRVINYANNIYCNELENSKLMTDYLISENQLFLVDPKYEITKDFKLYETEKTEKDIKGLVNLGCTCFMNAGTQCLLHSKQLTDYLSKIDTKGKSLISEFVKLFNKEESPYTPSSWKVCISKYFDRFKNFYEEDSHELILSVLQEMSEEDEGINNIFNGTTEDEIICKSCSQNIKIRENFKSISLQIPNNDVCQEIKSIFVPFSDENKSGKSEITLSVTYLIDSKQYCFGFVDDLPERVLHFSFEIPNDEKKYAFCYFEDSNIAPFLYNADLLNDSFEPEKQVFPIDFNTHIKTSKTSSSVLQTKFICKDKEIMNQRKTIHDIDDFVYTIEVQQNERMNLLREKVLDEDEFVSLICDGEDKRKEELNQSPVDLHKCLENYLKEDIIKERFCENCYQISDASKKTNFVSLPNILMIHLSRFYNEGMKTKKDMRCVDYPDYLEISNAKYKLYAVCCHDGDCLEEGHYFALCETSDGNIYRFDDRKVTKCSHNEIHSPFAYIVFYDKI
ncbi:Clan CA, family C19, ubiquitin hydrolase-like cysteine peptidase [Trichomonas vaginalis G3]|uniref:ubiquitinyl hydrolase 1 n=1 Tax=Trichomonas vaginalis (strain ATCC PRA-98 / G3) TaxID=412133 RepID=A2F333_TRIV3|nr:ubiquitinyl hydrolase protein [Trichomonas vaginalis G3]EAY00697.1 Clan CA, family C19, ubiquitin hydrolase-like cysteine peptidase [Trichomonas vaginalis G3]KAI5513275.1 ubiquitinyl hydrolase protein [Trichomonas vaginalis G3]|eukprot:XP_001313626.1 Clan CA, family C19, ubiquitin hydrolase-like cysteine peptidase [Trichomonas vaginalis G3]